MGMTVTFSEYFKDTGFLSTGKIDGKGKIVHFTANGMYCIVANFSDKKLYQVDIDDIKLIEF